MDIFIGINNDRWAIIMKYLKEEYPELDNEADLLAQFVVDHLNGGCEFSAPMKPKDIVIGIQPTME